MVFAYGIRFIILIFRPVVKPCRGCKKRAAHPVQHAFFSLIKNQKSADRGWYDGFDAYRPAPPYPPPPAQNQTRQYSPPGAPGSCRTCVPNSVAKAFLFTAFFAVLAQKQWKHSFGPANPVPAHAAHDHPAQWRSSWFYSYGTQDKCPPYCTRIRSSMGRILHSGSILVLYPDILIYPR